MTILENLKCVAFELEKCFTVIKFCIRHSQEMYCDDCHLCLSVACRIFTLLHGCGCNWGMVWDAPQLCTVERICSGCTSFVAMVISPNVKCQRGRLYLL